LGETGTYRSDVDGLRAVAILVVVAFHVGLPGFSGGFVGVDVFFVISGFLITGLLVREQERSGRIDILDFYARRVRRLVPAMSLVLVAVMILGLVFLLPTGEQQALAKSVLAVTGFVSNFHFKAVQSDYFGTRADELPLLHTWTLAVEEQFYLFWPLALAMTAWLASAARLGQRNLLVWLIVAGSLASLVACVVMTWKWPQWTFFVTPFRVWEFGAGALIALLPPGVRIGPRWGACLTLGGTAAILASAVLFSPQTLFPGMAALLPVAGAAAVIAGGAAAPTAGLTRLLGSAPMVAIGKVSYSWYLWHWPLLAFWSVVTLGERSLAAGLSLSLLALLLAALTWRFVEQPVRRLRPGLFSTNGGAVMVGVGLLAVCAALAGGLRVWADHGPVATERVAAATVAIRTRTIPLQGCELQTAFDRLPPAADCQRGATRPSTTVLLWGDSHARHLEPVATHLAGARGYAVLYRVKSGCRPRLDLAGSNTFRILDCVAFNKAVLGSLPAARDEGVRGVVISARWEARQPRWREDLTEIVARLREQDLRVLLLADVPQYSFDVPACVARRGWAACDIDRAAADAGRAEQVRFLEALAASDPEVAFWDPANTMCSPTTCSPVRGRSVLYAHRGHLSRAGAMLLAGDLAPALDWVGGRIDARP